jgi:type III secretion apparatus needle protein
MSINNILGSVGNAMSTHEASVKTAASADLSDHKNMINLQMQMGKYTAFTQLQSNLVKELGEMTKSIARNVG